MNISKLDAAKRQLDTAINLFFLERDPVSIHTLVSSSYDILIALAKDQGVEAIIKSSAMIKKGMEGEWFNLLNEAQNFFKHADRDPKGILEFNPAQTESFLYDASRIYMELTKEKPSNMLAYRAWFFLRNPEILDEATRNQYLATGYNSNNKSSFFDLIKLFDKH